MIRTLPAIGLLLLGCGESKPAGPEVFPVRGEVFLDGKPAAGATVAFHPVGNPTGRIVQGIVQPDGSFALTTTTKGDGAPAGTYAVCLSWTEAIEVGDVEKRSPDKFGKKYDTPATPYQTFTVMRGDNSLPRIDIKSP